MIFLEIRSETVAQHRYADSVTFMRLTQKLLLNRYLKEYWPNYA